MPDAVYDRLVRAPVPNTVRADAWDVFQQATDADDLAKRLQTIKIPDDVKADLWDMKQKAAPVVTAPVVTAQAPAATTPPLSRGDQLLSQMGRDDAARTQSARELVKGAAKGAGNTAFGLGKKVHDYTPIGRISDAIQPGAFDEQPSELQPTNTEQKLGYGAEQVGEFFIPAAKAGAVGKFVNSPRLVRQAIAAAQSGGLTLAQGGSPTSAGVSAAISAAVPGAGSLSRAAGKLETSAEKSVAQALGATKEWAKSDAAKLAPEMLGRGVGGSREAMLALARAKVKDVGPQIGAAYQAAAAVGQTVDGVAIGGTIAAAKDAFQTTAATGKTIPIPGTEAIIRKLDKLEQFVTALGPDIPVDKAAKIKTTWDHIVSKAGLFGPKATASATDNASAWAIREASGSFRDLLSTGVTGIDDLNREYAFWSGLKNVLRETEKRTQAQAGGLTQAITGAAGAGAGFASGDSVGDRFQKALIGGVLGKQIVRVVQSPAFRTQVSGPLKQTLANALAAGDQGQVFAALGRITASLPGQFAPVQGR